MQPSPRITLRTIMSPTLLLVALAACSGGGTSTVLAPNGDAQASQSAPPAPTGSPVATRGPATVPTAVPTSVPTPVPTPTPPLPTPVPTPKPTATPTPGPPLYDPSADSFPNFRSSEFFQRLPTNPTVNVKTSTWLSSLGTISLGQLQFAANPSGVARDFGTPVYETAVGPRAMAVKVHCTEPWGTCAVEGKTVYVESSEQPEDGGTNGEDSHFAIVDNTTGDEYDFWGTRWPPSNGVLTIEWGGSCKLSGPGYGGCGGSASGTALSLGIIRAKDLVAAVQSGGTLPYALSTGVKCADGYVAPMTSSDEYTPGCPPEGARAYLALHDSDVNASGASDIVKAILRTIDEDHYGMFITDSGSGDGFSFITESDVTYTAFGLPGPLVNTLVPLAQSEGIPGSSAAYEAVWYLHLPATGINLSSEIRFL